MTKGEIIEYLYDNNVHGDFNPLIFIANHAGMNLADAIKEAYEQGKRDAQPQPKTGKWIDKSGGIEGAWNYCSVCGEQAIDLYDYCPNCGAKLKDGD